MTVAVSTNSLNPGDLPVRCVSLLRSHVSWAKVARELILALDRLGINVSVEEHKEPQFLGDFSLSSQIESIEKRENSQTGIDFVFVVPQEYQHVFTSRFRTAFLVFEATKWPQSWVELGMKHLHAVVVPSQFCRSTLLRSGLTGIDVHVIPHGIDPNVYSPCDRDPPGSSAELHILFVGTPALRKGLDVFLEAVETGFPGGEGVRITIKTSKWENRPDSYGQWEADVQNMRDRGYRIETITENLSETEMAGLYRGADLLCQPHRGEGFGLPILESMACGTPAVVTAWSGPLDFVTRENGFLIDDFELRDCGTMIPSGFGHIDSTARMVEPSAKSCAQILRSAAVNRESLRSRSVAAIETGTQWTWERAAKIFVRDVIGRLPDSGECGR